MTRRFALRTCGTVALLSTFWGVALSQNQQSLGRVSKMEGDLKALVNKAGVSPRALTLLRGAMAHSNDALEAINEGLGLLQSGAATSSSSADSGLVQLLAEAEEQYQLNLKARAPLYAALKHLPSSVIVPVLDVTPTYPCPLEARLGNWTDGAKWVCIKHLKMTPPVVVSIGCNGETSFEAEIASRMGGFSYVFDPSLNQTKQNVINSFFFLKFFNVG